MLDPSQADFKFCFEDLGPDDNDSWLMSQGGYGYGVSFNSQALREFPARDRATWTKVALHEIGHVIGLAHANSPGDVMEAGAGHNFAGDNSINLLNGSYQVDNPGEPVPRDPQWTPPPTPSDSTPTNSDSTAAPPGQRITL